LLLGQYPSTEDIAAMREGKAKAPIGKTRPAAEVPLPGQAPPLAAAPAASGAANERVAAVPVPVVPR